MQNKDAVLFRLKYDKFKIAKIKRLGEIWSKGPKVSRAPYNASGLRFEEFERFQGLDYVTLYF